MNPKWAEENLQTIRTLMERSAIYRRALAPIMIYVGTAGIIGGIICWKSGIVDSGLGFVVFWLLISLVALLGTSFLVRRQALKDSEPFWSPPAKRIAQALFPAFTIGGVIGCIIGYEDFIGATSFGLHTTLFILIPVWCLAYGCAICSAGFFMQRGIKIFGWLFILTGFYMILVPVCKFRFDGISFVSPHLLMGGIFGGLHFAYGIYLYFTERKNPVA